MGQRLVIGIQKDDEIIAAIYYHWSAYTVGALQETRNILDWLFDYENKIKDTRLRLIRFVEANGGCIDGGKDSDEWKRITKMYPNHIFKETGSRNNGLIALSEEGIKELYGWSEGNVLIDLDTGLVENEVYWEDTLEEYNANQEEDEQVTLESIPELDIDVGEFIFEEIDHVVDTLNNFNGYVFRKGADIYQLIA